MTTPHQAEPERPSPTDKCSEKPANDRNGYSSFPIVGLGASAGGLEASTQFLANLPPNTGMAFVLVQHLDPRRESRLTDLLAKSSSMPVLEATHGLEVRPNHVYVIPPNASMAITQGQLHVTPRPEGRGVHLPIDHFFRSLAEDQQARAIAVVLSGTGSDGTLGLAEIKAVGGITFAQDEQSAKHNGMVLSAIDSGAVDFVMAPEAIARRLAEISAHPYLAPAPPSEDLELEPSHEESFRKILSTIRGVTGVDFSLYRDTTIKRRIMRRMALHTLPSLTEYAKRLAHDRNEVDALYHDLLINVTSFFRDPMMFEALKESVLPKIVEEKSPTAPIRIWVPGCSSGQEAYSLAITLLEFYEDKLTRPPIQIFGTDLNEQNALEKGRAGLYPESIEGEVSPERLRRFFKREDHMYRIDKSIRDLCIFARQNVAADPPFSHLDLISCRNVLIYLSTALQKRVLPTFHYALNIPGFLLLGAAETVGESNELFELVDRTHKIYSKKAAVVRPHFHFSAEDYQVGSSHAGRASNALGSNPADFQREADRILLGRYAPPGVLVNKQLDILQFRGRTSPYLESPPGEPTTNLLKMAREGLFVELQSALKEAMERKKTVRREGLHVRGNGGVRVVNLEVVPVRAAGNGECCFLVMFQEETTSESAGGNRQVNPGAQPAAEATTSTSHERELLQLQQELAATKEYMQSLVEQQDAANEELRSANEEILSSNEELQSTNEELETAKEELQSANEELTTVNEELQNRNLELSQVNDDLTNLLSSINMPLVMIGGDLRIRRFTSPAKKALNVLPNDIGRSINDLKPSIHVPDLRGLIGDVIDRVQSVQREVRDQDGQWHILRICPYRTAENKNDGAVLVLVDIDQLKRTEVELRDAEARMRSVVDHVIDGIISLDENGKIESFNLAAEQLFGYGQAEILGQNLKLLLPEQPNGHLNGDATWDLKGCRSRVIETTGRRKDGSTFPMELAVNEFRIGSQRCFTAIVRDITERKRLENALHQRLNELAEAHHRKDEFLATLAHELRNPLGPLRNAVEIMRRSGDDPEAIVLARDMLDRQVRQLTRIIEDLIDVSRVVEQKVRLRKECITLDTVVEMALETSRSLIEARGHELNATLPSESLYLEADPARLAQVLINLLNNAAKYTEPGGRIWLTAERAPAQRKGEDGAESRPSEVIVRVRDTGIGIPTDLLPHVFEMFSQGEHTVEGGQGGLGIGLTLVRSLVELHGGTIEAHSGGSGRGSEFIVRLPLTEAPATAPAKPTPEFEVTTPKRILVVDDSQDQARSLAMLLRLMGHDVRQAYDGPSALEILADFVPDVALLDIGLPEMNGYELARRIRAQPRCRETLLAAQTGWGQDEDRRRSREAGFDYHLVKPVSPEAIEEILQTLARR